LNGGFLSLVNQVHTLIPLLIFFSFQYEHFTTYSKTLEKRRLERENKLQRELEVMLDNKFRLLQDNIETHIENENRILRFETQLLKMQNRILGSRLSC
jgi:hypothetical protein